MDFHPSTHLQLYKAVVVSMRQVLTIYDFIHGWMPVHNVQTNTSQEPTLRLTDFFAHQSYLSKSKSTDLRNFIMPP